MDLTREHNESFLYPMMVIAAIAFIVFSIVGTASMMGWLPKGLVKQVAAATVDHSAAVDPARSAPTFQCAECGVIASMRDWER